MSRRESTVATKLWQHFRGKIGCSVKLFATRKRVEYVSPAFQLRISSRENCSAFRVEIQHEKVTRSREPLSTRLLINMVIALLAT